MRHGLIDEFRILVHPAVLGQGRPMFEAPGVRMDRRLEEIQTLGNGVVLLHYSNDGANGVRPLEQGYRPEMTSFQQPVKCRFGLSCR